MIELCCKYLSVRCIRIPLQSLKKYVQINTHKAAQLIGPVWLNGWVFVYVLSGLLYLLVYNSFYQQGPLFVYWCNISTFQTMIERFRFSCFFYTYCDSVQKKITFFKNISWNFTNLCRYTWLNENSVLIMTFLFIVFIFGERQVF